MAIQLKLESAINIALIWCFSHGVVMDDLIFFCKRQRKHLSLCWATSMILSTQHSRHWPNTGNLEWYFVRERSGLLAAGCKRHNHNCACALDIQSGCNRMPVVCLYCLLVSWTACCLVHPALSYCASSSWIGEIDYFIYTYTPVLVITLLVITHLQS